MQLLPQRVEVQPPLGVSILGGLQLVSARHGTIIGAFTYLSNMYSPTKRNFAVNRNFDIVRTDISGLRTEIMDLKKEVTGLDQSVTRCRV